MAYLPPRLPLGAMVNLTFQFVDPATDLPTTGPPIASVEYLVHDQA
jgi:hypothetical protein